MKSATFRLSMLLLSASLITACSSRVADTGNGGESSSALPPERVRTEVQEVVRRHTDAMNRADVSAYLEHYARTPAVTSIGGGDITRGWESLRAEADSTLTGMQGGFNIALGSIEVESLGAQHAMAVTPFTLVMATQRGPAEIRGAWTFLLQRAGSGWVIIHDHSSAGEPRLR
jgi:ketosteroid isomerase-like protein